MASAPSLTQPPAPQGSQLRNVLDGEVKVKVSSGSSKDGKNVLDGSSETCWTSDHLPPNSDPTSSEYLLSFKFADALDLQILHSLALTFAGGFCPMSLEILSSNDGKSWQPISPELHPQDTNAKQYFTIKSSVSEKATWLRFRFRGSTDDYGRLTVYEAAIFAVM